MIHWMFLIPTFFVGVGLGYFISELISAAKSVYGAIRDAGSGASFDDF